MDFDHNGKMIVAIDQDGCVLVTEVDQRNSIYNIKLENSKTMMKIIVKQYYTNQVSEIDLDGILYQEVLKLL